MIAPRTKGRIYLQSFMDALITFSSYWAFLFLFVLLSPAGSHHHVEFWDRYLIHSFVALGAVLLQGARTIYSHPGWWAPTLKESHRLSLSQIFNVAVGISLLLVASGDRTLSRTFFFCWLPLLYLSLLMANRFLPAKITETVYHGWRERTVFLGNVESTEALAAWRRQQEAMGTDFLDYHPDFSIADLANLERLMRERNVTQLVLTEIPEIKYNLHYVIDICERLGVRLMVSNSFEQLFRHKVTFYEEAGLQFIGLRDDPLERAHNRILKRVLDVSITLPALVLVLPLTAILVWLVQRFQSGGPIFVRGARTNLQGRRFSVYKFRTRHLDSETESNDDSRSPGTYPFGGWLHRTGLDELPQFFNVLRGQMSVVGPRPHSLAHNEQLAAVLRNYFIRSDIKPGVTGLAQVRGLRGETRTEQEIARRVEIDLSYLETWSLSLDIVIVAKTVWQIIRPPNANPSP